MPRPVINRSRYARRHQPKKCVSCMSKHMYQLYLSNVEKKKNHVVGPEVRHDSNHRPELDYKKSPRIFFYQSTFLQFSAVVLVTSPPKAQYLEDSASPCTHETSKHTISSAMICGKPGPCCQLCYYNWYVSVAFFFQHQISFFLIVFFWIFCKIFYTDMFTMPNEVKFWSIVQLNCLQVLVFLRFISQI